MITKQYTGLLALICVLGSGFAANQWLKFAKAQHAYQEQLASEKQKRLEDAKQMAAPTEEVIREAAGDALAALDNLPIQKA